ncbi:MAG: CDP-alcohol phosphatidyltransferase family protein [Candidatus Hydrothermales bacterium]
MILFKAHPDSKPKDGIISKYLNRYISSLFTKIIIKTNITPNRITFIFLIIFSSLLILSGILKSVFLTGLFYQLASIFDGVDGELARKKKLSSQGGALLDTVCDYTIDSIAAFSFGLSLTKYKINNIIILFTVSFTITTRLITQFIVKNTRGFKRHLVRDTRDIVVFVIFIFSILTEIFKNPYIMILGLILVNIWRWDNGIYRLHCFIKSEKINSPQN